MYDITHGNNQYSTEHNVQSKTKTAFSEEFGYTQQQANRYKTLLTLIPELQDLIETGEMPATVGYKVWAKLSQADQVRIVPLDNTATKVYRLSSGNVTT